MRPVFLTAIVLGGCAIASVFRPASSQPPERLPNIAERLPNAAVADPAKPAGDKPYGVGKAPFDHRPAMSCSASSCHGGSEPGKPGSEYTLLAPEVIPSKSTDPHSRAYRVLFDQRSKDMVQKLGYKEEAHNATQCLACHSIEGTKDPATRDQAILSEGVGCGACHGPADKWIGQHYTAEWKAMSNREKWDKYGFAPTKNLTARTLICASCHVGGGERDMNHDMIAAGHPRLAFEPASFHAQEGYPKHWTEKGDLGDFEVRLWVVGQAATLRASVNLLYERAQRAEEHEKKDKGSDTPWPEFSGYSCYACHQKLPSTEVRSTLSEVLAEKKRRPGVPGWELWSNTAIEVAAGSCELAFPGISSSGPSNVKLPALKALRDLMGQSLSPSPAEVMKYAGPARDELDLWLAKLQAAEENATQSVDADTPRKIANKLARNALSKDEQRSKLADHDWDALAANYLGAAAMYSAAGRGGAKTWEGPLLTLRGNLRFPPVEVGSRTTFNSPADRDFDRLIKLRENFESLRSTTGTREGK